MNQAQIGRWLANHRWLLAAVLVIGAGYALGKDMALRDNAADRAAREAVTG